MFAMSEVIVSFWFFPVTVFIVIPLLMLCGWTVFKLLARLIRRLMVIKGKALVEKEVIRTGSSL